MWETLELVEDEVCETEEEDVVCEIEELDEVWLTEELVLVDPSGYQTSSQSIHESSASTNWSSVNNMLEELDELVAETEELELVWLTEELELVCEIEELEELVV